MQECRLQPFCCLTSATKARSLFCKAVFHNEVHGGKRKGSRGIFEVVLLEEKEKLGPK